MENVIGNRYGRLVVLAFSHSSKNYLKYFLCKCDCGSIKTIRLSRMKLGITTSCGCFGREQVNISNRKRKMPVENRRQNMLFSYFRGEARKKKLQFGLTKEQCSRISRENCFYCGDFPKNSFLIYRPPDKTRIFYNGFDRVDNTKGYTIDNIVPCCDKCNKAKRALSQKQFFELVEKIYHRHVEKGM